MKTVDIDPKLFRFCFVDVETTGLDPRWDHVLELAIVVTDGDLNELAAQNWVGDRDAIPSAKARMDEVVLAMHTKNGLLAEMEKIEPHGNVFHEVYDFVKSNTFGPDQTRLAGYSVYFDRGFIENMGGMRVVGPDGAVSDQGGPVLLKLFHRRLFDVSSIKEATRVWFPEAALPPREDSEKPHRALIDCRDSIKEAKHYRGIIFNAAHTAHSVANMLGANTGASKAKGPGILQSMINGAMAHMAVEQGAKLGAEHARRHGGQPFRGFSRAEVKACSDCGAALDKPVGIAMGVVSTRADGSFRCEACHVKHKLSGIP